MRSTSPSRFAGSGVWRQQHRQTAQNGCRRKDAAGKQKAKIVPNASVEKCQKKAVRLVSAERHQKKNVCSAPAEMRQRKAVQSVRAELRQTAAAQSGNARQSAKESRLQRDYTPASAHRAAKESAASGERRNARPAIYVRPASRSELYYTLEREEYGDRPTRYESESERSRRAREAKARLERDRRDEDGFEYIDDPQ